MADKATTWRSVEAARRALVAAWLVAVAAGVPTLARADDVAPARGDLSVLDAVKIALAHNPDLGTSRAGVQSATGARNVALQSYLPRLTAGYNLSHSYNATPHFDQSSGQFTTKGGMLSYDVVLTRERSGSKPMSGVMQLLVAGQPARGPETTVALKPVSFSIGSQEILRGSEALPEGFRPRETTIQLLDRPAGKPLGMRVLPVKPALQ